MLHMQNSELVLFDVSSERKVVSISKESEITMNLIGF